MELRVFGAVLGLLLSAASTSAAPILITWTGTATGPLGSLQATGSLTVDSSQIGSDITVNGLKLTATVTDGTSQFAVVQSPFSDDHETVLRFTNTDLNNLSVALFDANPLDLTNDALVYAFNPWVGFAGGSCGTCEVALLVLHGENAVNAPGPFFISASPFDFVGSYSLQARVVPEPTSGLLVAVGSFLLVRRRSTGGR